MSVAMLTLILNAVGLYLTLGLIFALVFVFRGIGKVDPVAAQGSWGFRVLVIPGLALFWPLFAKRWIQAKGKPPLESNAHRSAAKQRQEGHQ